MLSSEKRQENKQIKSKISGHYYTPFFVEVKKKFEKNEKTFPRISSRECPTNYL